MPVDPWQNPKVVALLSLLHQVQPSGSGRKALCPAHADMNPSMQIDVDSEDGRILIHCHAGCDAAAILRALHLVTEGDEPDWSALFLYEMIDGKRCVAKYDYVDEHGHLLYQKLRFEPKTFSFRKPTQQGGWIPTIGPNTRRVVYHLDEIQGQAVVFIPEGEKDVDNLRALGFIATCNDSGASRNAHEPKWKADHSNQLQAAGVQMAIVLADNDEAGNAHAMAVAQSLGMVGIQAKVLHLPGLPEHGDVTDWIEAGATIEDLQAAADEAEVLEIQPITPAEPPSELPPAGTAPDPDAPLPTVDELLLDLTDEADPWIFLSRVAAETRAGEGGNCGDTSITLKRERARFAPMFYAKASIKSKSERDALISEATQILGVTRDTMRKEIERLSQTGATQVKIQLTVVGPDFLCESVFDPADTARPVKYLKWHFDPAPGYVDPEPLTEVQIGNVLYQPFSTPAIERGSVVLPTVQWTDPTDPDDPSTKQACVVDYGSDQELYQEVLDYINRIFYAEDKETKGFLEIVAGYVMMTWLYDRLDVLGYLRLLGSWGTGKSHLMQTVANACYRPLISLGTMSAPVIFRLLHKYRGTLAIDEADFREDDEDIFRILNGGYQKGGMVARCVGDNHEPEWFDVYGPKLLAGRERFHDEALESRCFKFDMKAVKVPGRQRIKEVVVFQTDEQGRTSEVKVMQEVPVDQQLVWDGGRAFPIAYTERQRAQAVALHNKLLHWRFDKYNQVAFDEFDRVVDPDTGKEIEINRSQQIILAILACFSTPALRRRLVANAEDTAMGIHRAFWSSKEGMVCFTFLDMIKSKNGEPDYNKRVAVSELAARLNAGKLPQDQIGEDRLGRILSQKLHFENRRGSAGSGYIGGLRLKELTERHRLLGQAAQAVRKQPVV